MQRAARAARPKASERGARETHEQLFSSVTATSVISEPSSGAIAAVSTLPLLPRAAEAAPAMKYHPGDEKARQEEATKEAALSDERHNKVKAEKVMKKARHQTAQQWHIDSNTLWRA